MIANHTSKPVHRAGFTLLEMMVNLVIIAFLLVAVAATATWSSDTVSKTTGRIAAMEKSNALVQILTADLARILPDTPSSLVCEASPDSWSLKLTLPRREGVAEEIHYRWRKEKQNITRHIHTEPESPIETIATGITQLESDWLEELPAADSSEKISQPSWSNNRPPRFLRLELLATRTPTQGPDTEISPGKKSTTPSSSLIPITAAR